MDPDPSTVDSTTEDLVSQPASPAGRWAGRAGVLVLVLVVAAGLAGALGPQTSTTTAEGGGYELEVEYTWLSRSGQPIPFHVQVTRAGGFPGETVTIELCDEFFDALDFQNWYPNPSAETVGDRLVYEFDAPPGNVLDVSLDARIAPGELGGRDECMVSVLEGDLPLVSVEFDSWRLP